MVSGASNRRWVLSTGASSDRLAHEQLSQHEFEVLRLLGSGTAVPSLSDKTVSTYRTRLLEKLCLKSNAELVRYALEHSLID